MTLVGPEAVKIVWRLYDNPRAAAQARRLVRDVLRTLPLPDAVVDDAVLMVSELVGNAVLHGSPPFELDLRVGDGELHAEVLDAGSGGPRPRDAGSEAEHGRGLGIVAQLSGGRYGCRPAAYATERDRYGKAVWCAMRIESFSTADPSPAVSR
ncbi:ATP-binding protein [Thermopolyspora sp. NPDC052614]|uniref:ATP-binding protein n=1 Tax=Thermopolyspora sp. NPDC052614 TaxID=3155682 RepID=UPI0034305E2C